jgi:lipid II:glycine glycyltransferase (peptidoglycan interpeptide bridge formation enzyme)
MASEDRPSFESAKFHRFGGMQLLLWTTIQDACKQGCTTLDLGRSRIDSLGELAFKDHWGTTRCPLVYWRYPAPSERTIWNM